MRFFESKNHGESVFESKFFRFLRDGVKERSLAAPFWVGILHFILNLSVTFQRLEEDIEVGRFFA